MKLPNFLSNQTDSRSFSSSTTASTWPWPSCTQTRTLSFRTPNDNNMIFKTINSAFLDSTTPQTTTNNIEENSTLRTLFTNSLSDQTTTEDQDPQSSSFSTSTARELEPSGGDPVEEVIKGISLKSERLFFKPDETSSILEEAKPAVHHHSRRLGDSVFPFKESVALSMESENPFLDFKKSMGEMVEANGIKEWDGLEELLCWYLKMNCKENHGYIVGAFVDLLVGLAFNNISINSTNINANTNISKSCSCSNCNICYSPYSPLSFCNTCSSSSSTSSSSSSSTTNPCVSSNGVGEEEIETPCLSSLLESTEEEDDDDASS